MNEHDFTCNNQTLLTLERLTNIYSIRDYPGFIDPLCFFFYFKVPINAKSVLNDILKSTSFSLLKILFIDL